MSENLVKQESYFTRREWILRYSTPFKSLMFMAGPMIIIMLVNSLYGIIDKQLTLNFAMKQIVDALGQNGRGVDGYPAFISPNVDLTNIVGHVSKEEFAKQLINVSTQYSNTVITVLQALSLFTAVGTRIKFSQAMGERNKDKMNNIVITGFIQTWILIILGTLLMYMIYPFIITSQAGIDYSSRYSSWQYELSDTYSRTFILGFALSAMANFFITLILSEGKVWYVVINNSCCVFINVGFGILFMDKLGLGMAGAVYGTMVAWAVSISVSVSIIAFSKNTLLKPNFRRYVMTRHDVKTIWITGLSPLFVYIVLAVSSYTATILINNLHDFNNWYDNMTDYYINKKNVLNSDQLQDYIDKFLFIFTKDPNHQGQYQLSEHISNTLRIMSSATPWMTMVMAPIIGMSQGASVNYGYCVGANKRIRIKKIYIIHLWINIIWLILAEILMFIFCKDMLRIFAGPTDRAWWFMCQFAPLVFASVTFTTSSCFQGLGNPKNALIVSISRAFVFQISFIVIGWSIARSASSDGSHDWTMFLLNGLQEVPAFILAVFMLIKTYRNSILAGRMIDVPDGFQQPKLPDVVAYEHNLKAKKIINYHRHKFENFKYKHQDDKELIEKKEKELNSLINFINNKTNQEIIISDCYLSVAEAKNHDFRKYKRGVFNYSKEAKECDEALNKINELQKLDNLVIPKRKISKLFRYFNKVKKIALLRFDRRKNRFMKNEDQNMMKINKREEKISNRKKLYIENQNKNKIEFEKKIENNPELKQKLERKKNRLLSSAQKRKAKDEKNMQYVEKVLEKREAKRKQKLEM